MNLDTLTRVRTDRYLDNDSVTVRMHAQAAELIPGATSRLHYLFKPRPIYAHSGQGCRLTDVDGDERIDCLNNMTALIDFPAAERREQAIDLAALRAVPLVRACP